MAACMRIFRIRVGSPIFESRNTEMIFDTWDVHAGIGLEERIRFEGHRQGFDRHSVIRRIQKKIGCGCERQGRTKTYTGQSSGRGM